MYEVDGDVVDVADGKLKFQPIGGGEVLVLKVRKITKRIPPHPRIFRLTHDGKQALKLECFRLD